MGKIERLCPQCNKPFYFYPSTRGGGIQEFCSRTCQKAAARIDTTCPRCGKAFWYHRCWPRIYCSRACSGAVNAANFKQYYRVGRVDLTCEQCGKVFSRNKYETTKARHFFCGSTCFGDWLSLHNVGEQNPKWKGGHPYGPNWFEQRDKARERDQHTCQRCGITKEQLGKSLDTHHIIPFRMFGRERYLEANELANLITYCPTCHTTVEHEANPR